MFNKPLKAGHANQTVIYMTFEPIAAVLIKFDGRSDQSEDQGVFCNFTPLSSDDFLWCLFYISPWLPALIIPSVSVTGDCESGVSRMRMRALSDGGVATQKPGAGDRLTSAPQRRLGTLESPGASLVLTASSLGSIWADEVLNCK